MSKTISIRLAGQSGRKAGGQRRHDMRDPQHVPAYVDRDKGADNSVIIAPPEPSALRDEIAKHRAAAGQQKLRADARISYSGIITFGTEAQPIISSLPKSEQDALYQQVAERIAERADRDLIGLVVHRDEAAPHAHFTLRGYKLGADGKEQPLRLGKKDTAELQDIAAAEVASLGIERGKPKAQRIADGEDRSTYIHRSVKQLHEDLPREIEAAQDRWAGIQEEIDEAIAPDLGPDVQMDRPQIRQVQVKTGWFKSRLMDVVPSQEYEAFERVATAAAHRIADKQYQTRKEAEAAERRAQAAEQARQRLLKIPGVQPAVDIYMQQERERKERERNKGKDKDKGLER